MKDLQYYSSFKYRLTAPFKRAWFKFLLSRNMLIKVGEKDRGIGKTYMMIDRAIKYEIPIIAGNQKAIEYIKRVGNPCEVHGFAKNFTRPVLSKEFPNGILIDDSVDPELIPLLIEKFNIRGGFIRSYGSGE